MAKKYYRIEGGKRIEGDTVETLAPSDSTVQVSFRLAIRLKDQLDELRKRTGWTNSKLMALMIDAGLFTMGEAGTIPLLGPVNAPHSSLEQIARQIHDYRPQYEEEKKKEEAEAGEQKSAEELQTMVVDLTGLVGAMKEEIRALKEAQGKS